MKLQATVISLTEVVLIAAMGGIGAYAFASSSVFDAIKESGSFSAATYLPLIIWGLLTAMGVLNIIFRNKGSGSFIWLVVIFALPSLLAHNTVNWLGIFGADIELTSSLGFSGLLALGVLIITGYVVLNYLRVFKRSQRSLAERQATPADMDNVSGFSYLSLLMAIAAAIAATVITSLIARNLELLVLDFIRNIPWNVVFIGLFCFMLIAFYIYWLAARRRTKNPPPPGNV